MKECKSCGCFITKDNLQVWNKCYTCNDIKNKAYAKIINRIADNIEIGKSD